MKTKPTLEDMEKLVAVQLGKRKVTGSQRFFADLGAESMDVVNMVAAVEETYHITLDQEAAAAMQTVADLFELTVDTLEHGSTHRQ